VTQKPKAKRSDIRVFAYAPGTERILCRLERLTIFGAAVILQEEDPTVFPVGGDLTLRFNEVRSGANLKVACQVVDRKSSDGATQEYGVRFENPQRIRTLLRPVLAKLFSGRQAFRATPRVLQPIEVFVDPPQDAYVSAVRAPLMDISTTGLACLVPVDFEEEMAAFDVLRLSFTLPNSETPIDIAGVIRNRHVEIEGIRYGIQFFKKGTTQYRPKLERIIKFVMDRQREQLDEWDEPTGPNLPI